MWQNSGPSPGDPEYLRVYWNDMLLEEKIWTEPVQPADLFSMIAQQYLIEGQHRLRYSVETANQVQTESETLVFVIDKTAPVFEDEGALIFRKKSSVTVSRRPGWTLMAIPCWPRCLPIFRRAQGTSLPGTGAARRRGRSTPEP